MLRKLHLIWKRPTVQPQSSVCESVTRFAHTHDCLTRGARVKWTPPPVQWLTWVILSSRQTTAQFLHVLHRCRGMSTCDRFEVLAKRLMIAYTGFSPLHDLTELWSRYDGMMHVHPIASDTTWYVCCGHDMISSMIKTVTACWQSRIVSDVSRSLVQAPMVQQARCGFPYVMANAFPTRVLGGTALTAWIAGGCQVRALKNSAREWNSRRLQQRSSRSMNPDFGFDQTSDEQQPSYLLLLSKSPCVAAAAAQQPRLRVEGKLHMRNGLLLSKSKGIWLKRYGLKCRMDVCLPGVRPEC